MTTISTTAASTKILDTILLPAGAPGDIQQIHVVTVAIPTTQTYIAISLKTKVPVTMAPVLPVDLVPTAPGISLMIFSGLAGLALSSLNSAKKEAETDQEKEEIKNKKKEVKRQKKFFKANGSFPPPLPGFRQRPRPTFKPLRRDVKLIDSGFRTKIEDATPTENRNFIFDLEIAGNPEKTKILQKEVEKRVGSKNLNQSEIFAIAEEVLQELETDA